jgi:hypothetical protein
LHQLSVIESNKNKLCKDDINTDDELFILYKVIYILYICDPEYVELAFALIKKEN